MSSATPTATSAPTDVAPDDNGVAIYRFKNGEIGTLFNGSTTVAGINTTEIYGDEGTLIQDYRSQETNSCRMIYPTKEAHHVRTISIDE